jgi:hypothetical protein
MSLGIRTYAVVTAFLVAGVGGAEAFPAAAPAIDVGLVAPAAMCGNTCRSGGRYFPGPPSVCADEGLSYCGPSRGGGGYRERDIEVEEAPRRRPGYDAVPYGSRGYGGGAPRASMCVTSRGNCATRPSPPGTSCSCDIPGFGEKHGAVGR